MYNNLPLLLVCMSVSLSPSFCLFFIFLSLSVNHSTTICNEREIHTITHFHLILSIKKYSLVQNYIILLQFENFLHACAVVAECSKTLVQIQVLISPLQTQVWILLGDLLLMIFTFGMIVPVRWYLKYFFFNVVDFWWS